MRREPARSPYHAAMSRSDAEALEQYRLLRDNYTNAGWVRSWREQNQGMTLPTISELEEVISRLESKVNAASTPPLKPIRTVRGL